MSVIHELHLWVAWLGGLLGATYFVTSSVLFAPIRIVLARRSVWLMRLLYCTACSATWLGLLSFLSAPFVEYPADMSWPTTLEFVRWLGHALTAVGFTSMTLGLLWGGMIKSIYGDVYERERNLIHPGEDA